MKGNEQGIQKAEGLIAGWMASSGIDPESESEYIYSNNGAPVWGLSRIMWEDHAAGGYTKHSGKKVAKLSARWGAVRASGATLLGAVILDSSGEIRHVAAFGKRNRVWVIDALACLCDGLVADKTGEYLGRVTQYGDDYSVIAAETLEIAVL